MYWTPVVVILVLLLGPSLQQLPPLTTKSMYKEEDLVGLRVPDDASILVFFKYDGLFPGSPAVPIPTVCKLLEKRRRCMNVSSTDAIFEGM